MREKFGQEKFSRSGLIRLNMDTRGRRQAVSHREVSEMGGNYEYHEKSHGSRRERCGGTYRLHVRNGTFGCRGDSICKPRYDFRGRKSQPCHKKRQDPLGSGR